jgi:hypothetical protein
MSTQKKQPAKPGRKKLNRVKKLVSLSAPAWRELDRRGNRSEVLEAWLGFPAKALADCKPEELPT